MRILLISQIIQLQSSDQLLALYSLPRRIRKDSEGSRFPGLAPGRRSTIRKIRTGLTAVKEQERRRRLTHRANESEKRTWAVAPAIMVICCGTGRPCREMGRDQESMAASRAGTVSWNTAATAASWLRLRSTATSPTFGANWRWNGHATSLAIF